MNDALKKEVVELEKKLAHIRGVRVFVSSLLLFLTQLDFIAYFDFVLSVFVSGSRINKNIFWLTQAGQTGKTVPELEKTVGLMKKVVERLQRENENLKKSAAATSPDRVATLERENAELKVASSH